MVTAHAPMLMQCFIRVEVNFERKILFFHREFPFLAQARNMIMLQHLAIHFLLHQPSSCRLREVKNKGKFQTVSSKSGRGRLQEVPNLVI